MPTIVHAFDWPDRIVVGTVGAPGSRAFYLQARAGVRIVSVALEKEQSAQLAEMINKILDELMAAEDNPVSVPALTPVELVDNNPLEPVEMQFRAGGMSLGWDPSTAQVVIEAYPYEEGDGDAPESSTSDPGARDMSTVEPTEMLQVRIPVGTARAFAQRTLEVVGAGRSLCPLCGTPMDPDGHVCPAPGDL